MSENNLRKVYAEFLKFRKRTFIRDAKFWLGVDKLKLKKDVLNEIFNNYERSSFINFLKRLKNIVYSKNAFDFVLDNSVEEWPLYNYLEFLKKKGIVSIRRDGRVILLEKGLLEIIPPFVSFDQARSRIEKRLGVNLNLSESVASLFKTDVIPDYDQMPISVSSALFLVEKISRYIPLNKKFLFVGDDDLVSVFLALSNPKIESVVVDIDEGLLNKIREIASCFKLRIETKKVDIQRVKTLNERFTGFLVNPSYNLEGVKRFTRFGVSQLSKDGGYGFLEIGDESIGNRFLFLEKFFARENLIIREVLKRKIFYPWISLHKEDEIIFERMKSFFDEKTIKKNPKLASSLWVFEYLPFEVKTVKMPRSIYSYI